MHLKEKSGEWERGKNGSLVSLEVFKLLNLLKRSLRNEVWLLLRIVLTLKGEKRPCGHGHILPTAFASLKC